MKYYYITIIGIFLFLPVFANDKIDSDGDRILDIDELGVYYTDPHNADTDGDGYDDWIELNNQYSPYSSGRLKLIDSDFDNDGLSDKMELNFHSDPTNPDTDNDGYYDGAEIRYGYDPNSSEGVKLVKKIFIDKHNQLLSYSLGDVRMGLFPISTGRPGLETRKGEFKVLEKHPRRWSNSAKLWMPYWMMFNWTGQGIHELPEWPNGFKEGQDHLGIPVSHGCVRLGIGPAEELYNFGELGTPVFVN